MIITEQLVELNGIVAEINRSVGNRIILIGVSREGLHFESQNHDIYSADVTEVAFDFIDPEFIQIPLFMDNVRLRICDDVPAGLGSCDEDGIIFAFEETNYRSTGGAIHYRIFGDGSSRVDNAQAIIKEIGYIVAQSVRIRRAPLLSGNRLRNG